MRRKSLLLEARRDRSVRAAVLHEGKDVIELPSMRERLQRYAALRMENELRLERLSRLKSDAELPVQREADGSGYTGSSGDRMARAVERYMEYEDEVRPLIDANEHEMADVRAAVDALEDPIERAVLQMRYLQPSIDPETGRDSCRHTLWADIANRIYGNPYERGVKMVMGVHRKALEHIKLRSKRE